MFKVILLCEVMIQEEKEKGGWRERKAIKRLSYKTCFAWKNPGILSATHWDSFYETNVQQKIGRMVVST